MPKQASDQFGIEITVDDAMCDGCLASSGRQIAYCARCEIRTCGVDNLVDNLAHREDYACVRLDSFAKPGTAHRATLDVIRDRLVGAG